MSWRKLRGRIAMSDLALIKDNLGHVRQRIESAAGKRAPELQGLCPSPRLVAVTKTKPTDVIMQAYSCGQRHFGENYVQELVEKTLDPELQKQCPEIKFHFIGHLQRNKISKLLSVPGDKLFMVETIDSEGLAKSVNDGLERKGVKTPLNVMVQVNTSGEDAKSGIEPDKCSKLVAFVREHCPHLKFVGLMTIGALEPNDDQEPNKDFLLLSKLRQEVCKELKLELSEVELSMGMSADFEEAIELGSTNVRVGSTLFGARQKPA